MTTNELKKGDRVMLRCGWEADIMDNMKGNTRLAKVYGDFTEIGSVYSHDITHKVVTTEKCFPQTTERMVLRFERIEHTPAQEKLRKVVEEYGF